MSDLISRQAAIDALMSLTIYKNKREIVQAADKNENSWIGGVAECIDEIEDLPSVQPEIIHCKDCKYAEVADTEDGQDGYTCQFHRGSIWFSGSYCSWAERKKDAAD